MAWHGLTDSCQCLQRVISILGFGNYKPLAPYSRPVHQHSVMLVRPIPPPSSRTRVFLMESERKLYSKPTNSRAFSECSQTACEVVHAPSPEVNLKLPSLSAKGHKCSSVRSSSTLTDGQSVTFAFRTLPDEVQTVPMIFGQDDKNKENFQERTVLTVAVTNAE